MTMGRRAGERGAAMLEVVIVGTLLVVLAAMAAPLTAQAADRMRGGGAARYMASLVRAARARAIAVNRATAVVFESVEGHWRFRHCLGRRTLRQHLRRRHPVRRHHARGPER